MADAVLGEFPEVEGRIGLGEELAGIGVDGPGLAHDHVVGRSAANRLRARSLAACSSSRTGRPPCARVSRGACSWGILVLAVATGCQPVAEVGSSRRGDSWSGTGWQPVLRCRSHRLPACGGPGTGCQPVVAQEQAGSLFYGSSFRQAACLSSGAQEQAGSLFYGSTSLWCPRDYRGGT